MSASTTPKKKWRQTQICGYFCTHFSKNVSTRYTDDTPLQRRINNRNRRTKSMMSTSEEEQLLTLETKNQPVWFFDLGSVNIPKRKLPVPIITDEEEVDLENKQPTQRKSQSNKNKVPITLNKPSALKSLEKSQLPFAPMNASTPSSSKSQPKTPNGGVGDEAPHCSKSLRFETSFNEEKTIRVLENVRLEPDVCKSPKKEKPTEAHPKRRSTKDIPVKKEEKKLNFEYLTTMRKFYLNILKVDHLKSLMTKKDKEMLCRLFNLDKFYQYTCVKLFMWEYRWYNIFNYAERIGLKLDEHVVVDMYKVLRDNNFVETDFMIEDSFTLLNLLSLKDVREIQRSFKLINPETNKVAVISKLLQNCKTQITLTCLKTTEDVLRERIKEKMGACIKLSQRLYKSLYTVFLLNTFTNSGLIEPQEYFANVEHFNVVFPSYKIEEFHIFYTEDEFSRYLEAIQWLQALEKSLEKKTDVKTMEICKTAERMLRSMDDQSHDSREAHLERFTPKAVYIRILTKGGKAVTTSNYEQVREWFEYLLGQKFCSHLRAEWYCHLTLIYTTYLKNYQKAARLIITAFEQDKEHFSEVQLHELASRGKILNKKSYGLPAGFHNQIAVLSPTPCDRDWPQTVIDSKSLLNEQSGRKRTYVQRCENGDTTYLTVEQIALRHYRANGYPHGMHCEGNIVAALFCLLFWDVIYDSYVTGTFVSPVQSVPLDFHTTCFYTNREPLIKQRLKEIDEEWTDEELVLQLVNNFDRHSHETAVCQVEKIARLDDLTDIVKCVGRSVLVNIFQRLVTNFKVFRSGFPDLIVWSCSLTKAKFVEVKGENDTLSIKQKLWLSYLMDVGADVEVCHVQPKSTKKKINKIKLQKAV